MNSMHAHMTAGASAAATRARVQQVLGYGWPMSPCENPTFSMDITTKRPPRQLGQRTT
jgi:hypothetical protein